MHILFRPAGEQDLDDCYHMLPPSFVCGPKLRQQIPAIWREWLKQRMMLMTVLEDFERSFQRRIIGFGSSVFITEEFAEELKSGMLPPGASAHVAERYLEGASPIVDLEGIRKANSSSGLILLVTHIGWREADLTEEEIVFARHKILEAFGFTHSGYQLREILQEVYSEEEMRRGLAIGASLRTDYRRHYAEGLVPAPLPTHHPYLIGATRNEAQEGTAARAFFIYTPPRYHFKAKEQELLEAAMQGKSDAEIERFLYLSPSTVQKRWLAIYEKVASTLTEGVVIQNISNSGSHTRGSEKRRHLLAYLRHHPEELRPHLH